MTSSPCRRRASRCCCRRGAASATTLQALPAAAAARARFRARARAARSSPRFPATTTSCCSAKTTPRFYYGDRSIDKDLIVAVRVLINGAPIAAVRLAAARRRHAARQPTQLRGPAGRDRARSLGRGDRNGRRHDAGRVRRDSRARVAGAGAGGLRRGQAGRRATADDQRAVDSTTRSPATPARWLTARASTNSRSDSRLT